MRATGICDDCGQEVMVDEEGIALAHDADQVRCEGSGYYPIRVKAGGVSEVSGGHFESDRRRH